MPECTAYSTGLGVLCAIFVGWILQRRKGGGWNFLPLLLEISFPAPSAETRQQLTTRSMLSEVCTIIIAVCPSAAETSVCNPLPVILLSWWWHGRQDAYMYKGFTANNERASRGASVVGVVPFFVFGKDSNDSNNPRACRPMVSLQSSQKNG